MKESVFPLKENGLPQPLTRLRNVESGRTDCRTPCGGLACRLGRCFCFAEVSTGHPHRNDRTTVNRTFYSGCNNAATVLCVYKGCHCGAGVRWTPLQSRSTDRAGRRDRRKACGNPPPLSLRAPKGARQSVSLLKGNYGFFRASRSE